MKKRFATTRRRGAKPDFDPTLISERLQNWFRGNQRNLPWRQTSDPYAIWVSEVLLQQTTVAAVLANRRWESFLQRFPTVRSLAEAAEEDVLHEWSGLGYYRRARQLQKAAQAVVDLYGGSLPSTADELAKLPGVGRYTAGAVASFGFYERTPLVDTNVARVLARVTMLEEPLAAPATQKTLWQLASQLLPADGERTRIHNYAIMELGATVCTARKPACAECPIAGACEAYRADAVDRIPVLAARRDKVDVWFAAIVLEREDGCVLVRRNTAGEWHENLVDFPKIRLTEAGTEAERATSLKRLLGLGRWAIEADAPELSIRYAVTHHRITHFAVRFVATGMPKSARQSWASAQPRRWMEGPTPDSNAGTAWAWWPIKDLGELPLGSPMRRLVGMLNPADELFGR